MEIVASVDLRVQEDDGTNWLIADDSGAQCDAIRNVRGLLKRLQYFHGVVFREDGASLPRRRRHGLSDATRKWK